MPCGAQLEIGWIPVRKTVKKEDDVRASDHVEVVVRLLPILEQEQQDEILREELEQRGWERKEDGALEKRFGDAIAKLPPRSGVIRVETEATQRVTVEGVATGTAKEEDLAAQEAIGARAEEAATAKLERTKRAAERDIIEANIRELTEAEAEVRREASEAVNVTTKRALQKRAASMGEIESMHEGRGEGGGYELTITVKT